MRCCKCESDHSSVVDSRADGDDIRRRRVCQECGFRFTTYERMELPMPLVVKKDGRREPFNTDKVRSGLRKACEKRPVSAEAIDEVVGNIERILAADLSKEVVATKIGELVMNELRRLDEIAYVRFASVYLEFSDVSQFVETLEQLRGARRKQRSQASA